MFLSSPASACLNRSQTHILVFQRSEIHPMPSAFSRSEAGLGWVNTMWESSPGSSEPFEPHPVVRRTTRLGEEQGQLPHQKNFLPVRRETWCCRTENERHVDNIRNETAPFWINRELPPGPESPSAQDTPVGQDEYRQPEHAGSGAILAHRGGSRTPGMKSHFDAVTDGHRKED